MCFREYLATFKKTVAMHEVFLQRLAAHPVLRSDVNFKVFLEYEPEVLTVLLIFLLLIIVAYSCFCRKNHLFTLEKLFEL